MKLRLTRKKSVIGALCVVLIASAGYFVYATYSSTNAALEHVTASGTVVDLLTPEPLNDEQTGTVNMLIASNSTDDEGHGGAELTDSILVASYSLETNKLALISIPRDLWVTTDGSSMKINAVYTVGGMDALTSVVEDVTGLELHHRALISYNALTQIVDTLGGIDVTIASSDSRGIYDPMSELSLTNGTHHLDGQQALALARARNHPTYDGRVAYGLPNGDFDRIANQRLIASALLDKVSSSETLTNMSTLKQLITDLSSAVQTDFSVGQLRRLYDLSKKVADTTSLSIRGDEQALLLRDYTSLDGQSALVPTEGANTYERIRAYISLNIQPGDNTEES